MARLVMTAGQHAAGVLRAAGSIAAGWAADAVTGLIAGKDTHGPQLPELQVQTSRDGAAMPRIYGRSRIAGQVIWAANYREHAEESSGGKGGPSHTEYTYSVSFAVGLCEGPISGIGRVWANGGLLDLSRYNYRLHSGDELQVPDSAIEAVEGAHVPAFRDTAYIVFEDMPLDEFGHRIPNLSFEVFRPSTDPNRMEARVRGINLIPGSGEFAYDPQPAMHVLGPGRERAINQNSGRGKPDFLASLDDLERSLPNCRSIQLVLAWFGDDLRCGHCRIRPGVEQADKQTRPEWFVAGLAREQAHILSQIDGRPAYGGTPSDRSIVEAIKTIKARGFSVSLYPFILMDVPEGNALPDPYGGLEQAEYPWRGRITCHPASGQAGSADQTAAAVTQIDAFFGEARASDFTVSGENVSYSGGEEWGLNRFILHCASLAKAAGGVDGFLIGSELVAVTQIRDAEGAYPAISKLTTLAQEARMLLGPAVRLSYAADWTEYSGHQPADGEKIFHLDPLWSAPEIDAVAIDWYVPLSDWRDDPESIDTGSAVSSRDPDYLAAGVAGGEGFDWYYTSDADRDVQARTPIVDGLAGEDWVWRYKDLENWWRNAHFDRPGGVRSSSPTGWVPQSKPIWLTEVGCPAVDKGANQPNVFVDPKSSESRTPWFSSGQRDDLVQRRYLEAILGHWEDAQSNPVSPEYGERMIDPDLIHVWTWDARPWPDFPSRTDVWSDGGNWRLGHWLNGRTDLILVAEIISDICGSAGLTEIDVGGVEDLVAGYSFNGPQTARAALVPLLETLGVSAFPRADALHFLSSGVGIFPRDPGPLAVGPEQDGPAMVRRSGFELVQDVQLNFIDDTSEYRPAHIYARNAPANRRMLLQDVALLAYPDQAGRWCENRLKRVQAESSQLTMQLPPSALRFELGDAMTHENLTYRIAEFGEGVTRNVMSVPCPEGAPELDGGEAGASPDGHAAPVAPVFVGLDLPLLTDERIARNGILIAAFSNPWPGAVDVHMETSTSVMTRRARLAQAAMMGETMTDLAGGPVGYWDRGGTPEIELYGGSLLSREDADVLNGANRLAIEGDDGVWEVLAFQQAELVGPRRYRLSGLLRGLSGSRVSPVAAGRRVVLLDEAVEKMALESREVGIDLPGRVVDARYGPDHPAAVPAEIRYDRRDLRPIAPVHLRARTSGAGVAVNWIRCNRIDGDDWNTPDVPLDTSFEQYRIELLNDAENVIWSGESQTPSMELSHALLNGLFGTQPAELHVRVAQFSDVYGYGEAATGTLTL